MSKQKKGRKPPNEDLVRTLCNPSGEVRRTNGRTYLLFVCPHPYCNHRSGSNIISLQKNTGYSTAASHLKTCVGRDSIDDLNQLFLKIKARPDERQQILTEFQAEAAQNQKPKPETPATTSSRKRKRPYDILTENEMKDARNSVEHVLMIGSKNRHDIGRRQHFHTNHQVLLDMEHEEPLGAPPVNPFGPTEHPDNNVFAEDVRIYGERGTAKSNGSTKTDNLSPMPAWPRTTTKRGMKSNKYYVDDKEWDIEHGDTINPLAFSMARLSEVMPKEEDRKFLDGRNRLINTTDISLTEDQVPRALLLRCWERAVHAASCVTHVPKLPSEDPSFENNPSATKGATTRNATTASPNARSLYEAEQEKISCSRKATTAKCISLGFRLGTLPHENFTCPQCSALFDDTPQLEKHFYGGREEKIVAEERQADGSQGKSQNERTTPLRGCCWALIKEKHLSLINTALQRHIQTQTESLLGAVMTNTKEKVPDDRGTKNLRLMNWHDILKFMESTLESSLCLTNGNGKTEGSNPVLELLETKSRASPMVLNPAISEAVRRRLIDRYADVAM
jgi:hypothetical protein